MSITTIVSLSGLDFTATYTVSDDGQHATLTVLGDPGGRPGRTFAGGHSGPVTVLQDTWSGNRVPVMDEQDVQFYVSEQLADKLDGELPFGEAFVADLRGRYR